MDIIVSHINDLSRFKYFLCNKYHYPLSYCEIMINRINCKHNSIKFTKLKECEIQYFIYKKICKLKINMGEELIQRPRRTLQEACEDASRKTFKEIVDNNYKEAIRDSTNNGSFNVEYTIVKVVKLVNTNKNQINALLTDPNVKSINIIKNE